MSYLVILIGPTLGKPIIPAANEINIRLLYALSNTLDIV
jgi:hypothetical protein